MSYTVKSGDSLSIIAKKFGQPYSAWKELFNLNPQIGSNPDKIYPGQVLEIPQSWSASKQSQPQPEPIQQSIVQQSNSDSMNWVYIGGGLLLLYLAYKKRGRR